MTIAITIPDPQFKVNAESLLELGNSGGVYCLYSDSGEQLYIGKAKDIKNRLRMHFAGTSSIFKI